MTGPSGRLRGVLPVPLRALGSKGWVPWRWIQERHTTLDTESLVALFRAYRYLDENLDLDRLTGLPLRSGDKACRRCGVCCVRLVPEHVPRDLFRRWERDGIITCRFLLPEISSKWLVVGYSGWHFTGHRLKMCPLLIKHLPDRTLFCSVYHLGPGRRPPACEGFRANHPHCEVSQRPLVP